MSALVIGAFFLYPSQEDPKTPHAITCASAVPQYEPVETEDPDDTDAGGEPETPDTSEDTPEEPEGKPDETPLSPAKVTPDEKGMMNIDGTYVKAPDPLDEKSLTRFVQKLEALKGDYLGGAAKIKLAIIPDKSYYVRERTDSYLDHKAMTEAVSKSLTGWELIGLEDCLSIGDYYLTDPHWRQENILPAARRIASSFGFQVGDFSRQSREGFAGSYSRSIDADVSETIVWLENGHTKNAVVDNFQRPECKAVYEPSLLSTISPYDIFLGGPSPLVTIENTQVTNGKQLVIFCDSFGSSLAPLLLEGYSKITLVDLRYIVNTLLPDHVTFDGADILFIYSAELVNNSQLLK